MRAHFLWLLLIKTWRLHALLETLASNGSSVVCLNSLLLEILDDLQRDVLEHLPNIYPAFSAGLKEG